MSGGEAVQARADGLLRTPVVLAIYALLAVVFTFPALLQLGPGAQVALHVPDNDIFMKYWDHWYVSEHLRSLRTFLWATPIFYPIGAELAFHSWNLPHVAALIGLKPLVGLEGAFNVTAVLALMLNGYCSYLLIVDLLGDRAAAVYGGFVAGFIPYNQIHMSTHPDMMMMMGIPLAILLVRRALLRASWKSALAAALAIGFVGITGIYLLGLLAIILAPVGIYLLLQDGRWRRKTTWSTVGVLSIASAVALMPRLGPMLLRGSSGIGEALEKSRDGRITDLLSYIIPQRHPLFPAQLLGFESRGAVFLGIVPLVLALYALVHAGARRQIKLWAALSAVFFLLTLGDVFVVAGHRLDLPMLLPSLAHSLPLPFAAIRDSSYFMPGLGLLLGILTAAALVQIRGRARSFGAGELRVLLIPICLLALTACEYWIGPATRYPDYRKSEFLTRLAAEPGNFAIVHLPMGRQRSKRHIYYQTIHGKPIVEGVVGRTPREAYAFIRGNPLLDAWERKQPFRASVEHGLRFRDSLLALQAVDVRYVTLQRTAPEDLREYFSGIETVYRDDLLEVWRVDTMLQNPPYR